MKLIDFKYKSRLWDWHLSELNLNSINLLVGKNATGKSKAVSKIVGLAEVLRENNINEEGHWSCRFLGENGDILEYDLKNNVSKEEEKIEEKLLVNGKIILQKNQKFTKVYSSTQKKLIEIHPPNNTLVIHARKDEIEFPYFIQLINWAYGVRFYKFSQLDLRFEKAVLTPANALFSLTKKEHQNITKDLINIGFHVSEVYVDYNHLRKEPIIMVSEKGVQDDMMDHELSQGLYRTLVLLIYLEYELVFLNQFTKVNTIIIDDLGEGLDYERTTKLGKLLVEKLENSNIQFIATSNDSFLMDVVPIKYWNILQRDGNTVRALNYQNSKEQFDEFKLSGLSNFYLFSSDFLTQKQD